METLAQLLRALTQTLTQAPRAASGWSRFSLTRALPGTRQTVVKGSPQAARVPVRCSEGAPNAVYHPPATVPPYVVGRPARNPGDLEVRARPAPAAAPADAPWDPPSVPGRRNPAKLLVSAERSVVTPLLLSS